MRFLQVLLRAVFLWPLALPAAIREWDAAKETLVVFNKTMPESVELARYYARARGIPPERVAGLACSISETIKREEFNETLVKPLLALMKKNKWWEIGEAGGEPLVTSSRIRILALIYGVPVKVERSNDPGKNPLEANEASVDAELTLLPNFTALEPGAIKSPYYGEDMRFNQIPGLRMMLTARLDGPSAATVRRMIDDGLKAEKTGLYGRAYVDLWGKTDSYQIGDDWLNDAARLCTEQGITTVVETSPNNFARYYPMTDAILYYGWYTQDVNGPFENPAFRFKPGAIACHLHSFSAAELRQQTKHWTGPLLERGAAAAIGNVWEPYLHLTTHLQIFNDRLLKGYTLAEAHWMATPAVSWMNIIAGDPLYRPFAVTPAVSKAGPDASERDEIWLRREVASARLRLPVAERGKVPAWEEPLLQWREKLLKTAHESRSPWLFEYTGWLFAADQSYGRATDCFQHASAVYAKPADQLRCELNVMELMFRQGQGNSAVNLLKRAYHRFRKIPESASAAALLNMLAPPAPPPAPFPVRASP